MSDEFQDMWDDMTKAIVAANTGWARVENAMATLLEKLIGYTTDHVGFHIYFAPNNTETRFRIVDTLARIKIANKDVPHELLSEWEKVHAALFKAKETRNRIAHSQINTPGRKRKGKWVYQTRLMASSFDIGRNQQERPDQWPGMSIRDVKATADRFFWLAVRIEEIARYWETYSLRWTQPPLPEVFARIVERRQNLGPLQADLKPPKPKSRPQSSEPKPKLKRGEKKPSRRQRREQALKKV
jgi:hypothetical protein